MAHTGFQLMDEIAVAHLLGFLFPSTALIGMPPHPISFWKAGLFNAMFPVTRIDVEIRLNVICNTNTFSENSTKLRHSDWSKASYVTLKQTLCMRKEGVQMYKFTCSLFYFSSANN